MISFAKMNIYKQPTGEYQKFINAYALLHGAGKSRQSVIDEGNKNWKELKHDKQALNDFMVKAAQHHPRKRQASLLDTFNPISHGVFFRYFGMGGGRFSPPSFSLKLQKI